MSLSTVIDWVVLSMRRRQLKTITRLKRDRKEFWIFVSCKCYEKFALKKPARTSFLPFHHYGRLHCIQNEVITIPHSCIITVKGKYLWTGIVNGKFYRQKSLNQTETRTGLRNMCAKCNSYFIGHDLLPSLGPDDLN